MLASPADPIFIIQIIVLAIIAVAIVVGIVMFLSGWSGIQTSKDLVYLSCQVYPYVQPRSKVREMLFEFERLHPRYCANSPLFAILLEEYDS